MKYATISDKFKEFFQTTSSPVAVVISEKELTGTRPPSPSLFCDLVRKAAYKGETYTITGDDLINFSTRVILGFNEPQYVDLYPRVKPAKTKSIIVAPLEKIETEPNVIVIITDPAHAMLVIQLFSRSTKRHLEASMTCQGAAIAGEVVALPFMEHRPNLTLLCSGARELAGYSTNELALGLPFTDFLKMAEAFSGPT